MEYNVSKLDKELKAAGLDIHGVDSDGNIAWVADPTAEQQTVADAVKANHDPTPEPVPSKVKPLKAVINSLITLKDDGTYDFSEAMQFTTWLESSWARRILEPIFAMPEAEISKAEATMLTQFIESEVRQGKLSEAIASKIGALLATI